MGKALELAWGFERARCHWTAEASDILADLSISELGDAIEAIAKDLPYPPLWEEKPPHKLAMLAVPMLWGEIQRRMELLDLEE